MSVIVTINFARKRTLPQWVEIIVDTVRPSFLFLWSGIYCYRSGNDLDFPIMLYRYTLEHAIGVGIKSLEDTSLSKRCGTN